MHSNMNLKFITTPDNGDKNSLQNVWWPDLFAWLIARQVFTQTKNRFNYKDSRLILGSSKKEYQESNWYFKRKIKRNVSIKNVWY